jgi:hypothetical protein
MPEFVVLVIGLLATATLLFAYVRRRVGPWLALFAAGLLLFLGPAFEVLFWPFEIGFVGSAAFGLAMLLVIERGDRRGDLAACLFLVLCLGFSSLGLSFIVGAAVAVLQSPRANWRGRAFVVVVPVVLYGLWYLGWGHEAVSHLSLRNVLASPRFVAEAMAIAVGNVFGLGTNPAGGSTDPVWGRALLIALVGLFAYRQWRKPRFPSTLWPVAAAAATNWFLTAFNEFPGREPIASRYQYAGAIFILLILANLLQGVRFSKWGTVAAAVITAAAIGPNLVVLKDGRDFFEQQAVLTQSDTGAIEISRRTIDPAFSLTPEVAGTGVLINISAIPYLTAVDEYGSPAYTPEELLSAPEEGRRQADIVLAQALPISTATQLGALGPGDGGNCVAIPAGAGSDLALGFGLTRIEVGPGDEAQLALRRFSQEQFPVLTEGVEGDSVTVLRIPRDGAPAIPWHLQVSAEQDARVCR